jgi:hypothetical protein
MHPAFYVGSALLVVVIAAFYLLTLVLDWLLIHEHEPRDLFTRAFALFVWTDLRDRVVGRLVAASGASRTAWWFVIAFLGAIGIAAWIGGTEYLQSWAASLFRVMSGAALGYLISRFLLRINVSQVAELYPSGSPQRAEAAGRALFASSLVIAASVLAVALGM